jgi:hypothetical protein
LLAIGIVYLLEKDDLKKNHVGWIHTVFSQAIPVKITLASVRLGVIIKNFRLLLLIVKVKIQVELPVLSRFYVDCLTSRQ